MHRFFDSLSGRSAGLALARAMLLAIASLLVSGLWAAPLPYDEAADAPAAVRQALLAAQAAKRPVLVIFGANWCADCRALDAALQSTQTAALMVRDFVVVKVDIGHFDRNLDLAARYGNPIKKGIPAAAVVSPGNELIYATRAGELSNARRMSERGIHDFFRQAAALAKTP